MTDRRFNEDEVAEIFRQATEAQRQAPQRQLASGEGMTLAEIQEIGQQVGIAPELVGRAAASLTAGGAATSRKFLGLTIGVGHTIDLDRKLAEQEWEQLVVDLRETFDARGTVRQEGSFRQWTNGNLQVLLEPTPAGQRIRFRTVKANSRALMVAGLATLGFATFLAIAGLAKGGANHVSLIIAAQSRCGRHGRTCYWSVPNPCLGSASGESRWKRSRSDSLPRRPYCRRRSSQLTDRKLIRHEHRLRAKPNAELIGTIDRLTSPLRTARSAGRGRDWPLECARRSRRNRR